MAEKMKRHDYYWQNKIAAWMNETPIKAFDIENRNAIARELFSAFKGIIANANGELIEKADHIASGLTRAMLPPDESKLDELVLKHPLIKGKSVSFKIDSSEKNVENLVSDVKKLLEEDSAYIEKDTESQGELAEKLFNYLFFAFSKRLRSKNIGGLGSLWDIIPADTRMPDHPIWHHLGMTSAIFSSLERNEAITENNLSMVVYSITPVQEFIGKARKLRDYWTGSVLLSYLTFNGIIKVCKELGPDHILYPSLQNQALMETWLGQQDKELENYLKETDTVLDKLYTDSQGIASFPNKFVFICNNKDVKNICKEIESAINKEWKSTAEIVKTYIAKKAGADSDYRFSEIWDNAIDKYWKNSWAATNFANIGNDEQLKNLLPEEKWKCELETMNKFAEFFKTTDTNPFDVSNLYGTTHSLVQGVLAAGKTKPIFAHVHHSQNGEKCPLCGENEVLNTFDLGTASDKSAKGYSNNVRGFWDRIREATNADDGNCTQVGEHERLCAVCAMKRFLPVAIRDEKHLLYRTLVEVYKKKNFPSTTEMAAYEYLQTVPITDRTELVQKLHTYEFETNDDYLKKLLEDSKDFETKYYAFLLMDGDKMGDLINGESIEASWNDVLNLNKGKSAPVFDELIGKERLGDVKRTINPALHAMISDSLNNFARYGVQPLVAASAGRLIYAGGDDVCAILPVSTALGTADKIRQVYQLSFAEVDEKGSKAITEPYPDMKKIVMHLGSSDNQDETKISLSGAIIIAHHKTPLKEVISDAHAVLDGIAKEKSGRNSLAIRLKKRSGGDRDTWFKWDGKNLFAEKQTYLESFEKVISYAKKKDLSTSLLYRLETLRASIEPLAGDIRKNKDLIVKLFEYEVKHSIFKKDEEDAAHDMATALAGLCIKHNNNSADWYNPEVAIIANFIAQKEKGEKA